MKNLPLGYQDFRKIREEDKLYVDKTEYIWKIIQNGDVYFLSRPRRFGKSLLLSTLEYFFKGQRALFEGLVITEKPHDWKTSPVIFIRMNDVISESIRLIHESIITQFQSIAMEYAVDLKATRHAAVAFKDLIEKLYKKYGPVVVLIDEYDKPLLDFLGKGESELEKLKNMQFAHKVREFLKRFYGRLKPADGMLKFLFITGVSKFARTSIFSELNHLTDISFSDEYAALLGCTQIEVEQYFSDYITLLKAHIGYEGNILADIRLWYNGYRFSEEPVTVYNPYSLLSLFSAKRFRNFWFETGTPTFLIDLIKEKRYQLDNFTGEALLSDTFTTWDLDNLELLPLMFQTGYLTIKQVMPMATMSLKTRYVLDFPNYEVKWALLDNILSSMYQNKRPNTAQIIDDLAQHLMKNDLKSFFDLIKSIFANVPYEIHLSHEHYYQSLFYVLFMLIGLQPRAEEQTNQGRIDTVVETPDRIFIFEFKLDQPASEAMQQIYDRKYYEKFLYLKKPIRLVGVAINSVKREISEWKVEDC